MADDVIRAFRRRFAEDAPRIREESAVARVLRDPTSGDPPSRFHGLFSGIEHFERGPGGRLRVSRATIPFAIELPDDYCSCVDGTLSLRVARVLAPCAHPNIGPGGIVCLGADFRPATRLRPLVEHLRRICSCQVFASENHLDPIAADFFRRNSDRVRALRSEPLWRTPVAARVRVETARSGEGAR